MYLPQQVRVLAASTYLDANHRAQEARPGAVITVPGGPYLKSLVADGYVEEVVVAAPIPVPSLEDLAEASGRLEGQQAAPDVVTTTKRKKAIETPTEDVPPEA